MVLNRDISSWCTGCAYQRWSTSRIHFEVLGLGLEASSPRKLTCPRLEDSSIPWNVEILWSAWKIFWKTFFSGDRLKNFCEDLFFFGDCRKNFCEDLFFFWRALALCVLGPWPWPRAFLSLASRVSVLGKAVLGLGLGLEPCVLDSTSGAYTVRAYFQLLTLLRA